MEYFDCDGVSAISPRIINVELKSKVGQFLQKDCGFKIDEVFYSHLKNKEELKQNWIVFQIYEDKICFCCEKEFEVKDDDDFGRLCAEAKSDFIEDVNKLEKQTKKSILDLIKEKNSNMDLTTEEGEALIKACHLIKEFPRIKDYISSVSINDLQETRNIFGKLSWHR